MVLSLFNFRWSSSLISRSSSAGERGIETTKLQEINRYLKTAGLSTADDASIAQHSHLSRSSSGAPERLLLQGTNITFGQALGACFQDATHDLAGAGLGKLIDDLDVLGTGNRSHMRGDVLAQFFG